MSSQRPLAQLAMRALADARPVVVPPRPSEREDAIAAVARELEAVRARRKKRLLVAGVALAASVIAVVGVAYRPSERRTTASVLDVHGGVLFEHAARSEQLGVGGAVAKGDRIVASADGAARLRLSTGTELDVARGASLAVVEQGRVQAYELLTGGVRARVAKLGAGERFMVRTADTEVEVRGTDFRVDVADEQCAGTTTRVSVTEGTVVVRHAGLEARVTAGEAWPVGCASSRPARALAPSATPAPSVPPMPVAPVALPVPAALPATPPPAEAAPSEPVASTAPPSSLRAATPPAPSAMVAEPPRPSPVTAPHAAAPSGSELAEQNRAFAEAMAAKRRGDVVGALTALDRITAVHPSGPLAESAAVERMRLLAPTDRRRAADAARSYLARYPSGYAREEARALLASP